MAPSKDVFKNIAELQNIYGCVGISRDIDRLHISIQDTLLKERLLDQHVD
jgi:hypothetical protein